MADLIDGLLAVMAFFAVAVVIATRPALLVHAVSSFNSDGDCLYPGGGALAAGHSGNSGYELGPFSILVPFWCFAIGVSHGAQKLNGVLQDIGRGTHRYIAARYTFRRLFLAGVTALLSDGVGFAVLMIIQIQVIQDLAITASIGVLVLIFTNLILIPVALSYTGVGRKCAESASRPVPRAWRKCTGSGVSFWPLPSRAPLLLPLWSASDWPLWAWWSLRTCR